MRTNIGVVCAVCLAGFLAACEKDLPVYNEADDALNFVVTLNEETNEAVEKNVSFVYFDETVTTDTVWIQVNTQGFLSDVDRPFELRQVDAQTERPNAQAGVHYVSFDDEKLRSFYQIPAGANTARFPVVLKRDASLADGDVSLYFQLKDNAYFKQGLLPFRTVKLVISDRLSRPADWEDYYFGVYGTVKHRFMIDHTGLLWDDEFVSKLVTGDWGYIQYLMMLLARELEAENAERAKQGLKPLAEEDGREVAFSWGASFG